MQAHQELPIKTIDDFWNYLPEDELLLCDNLHELLLEIEPRLKTKLKFKVLFYELNHKNFAHLWPGSIPWGGLRNGTVALNFNQGAHLSDPHGILMYKNRKQIAGLEFQAGGKINPDLVKPYIFEALSKHTGKR